MEKSTLKRIAFWIGMIFHIIVVIGFLYDNVWDINKDLFSVLEDEVTSFVILSLFGSGFMIYGMFTSIKEEKQKNCVRASLISGFIWLYLIISMFFEHCCNFYLNWIILSISATVLLIFAMNNLINKQ